MAEGALVVVDANALARLVEVAVRKAMADLPAPASNRLRSRKEIADLLGVSPRSIDAMIRREGMPVRRVGRALRFYVPDVLAWTEGRALARGAHTQTHIDRARRLRRVGAD